MTRQPRLAGVVLLAGGLGLFWLLYRPVLHAGGSVVDGTRRAAHTPAPSAALLTGLGCATPGAAHA